MLRRVLFPCSMSLLLLLAIAGGAHAATDVAPSPSLGWPEYLAIGLAALAGLRTVVDVCLSGLKWLAPRTATKIDDTARDDLQLVHDKLDVLMQLVETVRPRAMPGPPTGVTSSFKDAITGPTVVVGRPGESGFSARSLLFALGMVGLLAIVVAGSACAPGLTAKGVAIAGKDALIDCGETEARNVLVQRIVPVVLQVLVNSTSADGKLVDTAPIKSAIGKLDRGDAYDEARIVLTCAAKVAFAKLAAPAAPVPGAPQSAALVADWAAVLRAEADVMATVAPGTRFAVEVQ